MRGRSLILTSPPALSVLRSWRQGGGESFFWGPAGSSPSSGRPAGSRPGRASRPLRCARRHLGVGGRRAIRIWWSTRPPSAGRPSAAWPTRCERPFGRLHPGGRGRSAEADWRAVADRGDAACGHLGVGGRKALAARQGTGWSRVPDFAVATFQK